MPRTAERAPQTRRTSSTWIRCRRSSTRRPSVRPCHISSKESSPAFYRNCTWKALRDGFEELVDYWHFDESASLSSSDTSHPYGSCYLDWDLDQLILSRRQLGADMAAMDAALEKLLKLL